MPQIKEEEKMSKFEIRKFDPVIYPRKVWVAKGGTKKNLADIFDDMERDPYMVSDDVVDNSYAMTDDVVERSSGDYGVVVWLHKLNDITTGIIAHEADHAANQIFKAIGAKVDVTNDEPHAYLVGFITDCIHKVKTGRYDRE